MQKYLCLTSHQMPFFLNYLVLFGSRNVTVLCKRCTEIYVATEKVIREGAQPALHAMPKCYVTLT